MVVTNGVTGCGWRGESSVFTVADVVSPVATEEKILEPVRPGELEELQEEEDAEVKEGEFAFKD